MSFNTDIDIPAEVMEAAEQAIQDIIAGNITIEIRD